METSWIIIIFSTISLLGGVIIWQKSNRLRLNGRKAIGIIISNNYQNSGSSGGVYYPVIRFLTEDKEWITKELSIGFRPAKREGKKLKIIYNAEDPTEFQLDSVLLVDVFPRMLVALGITGLAYGLMGYLGYV